MIGGTEAIPGSGQYIIDCSTIDSLPSLTFIINGKDYVVNGKDYVLQVPTFRTHRGPFGQTGDRTLDVSEVSARGQVDVVLVILHLFDDFGGQVPILVLLALVLRDLRGHDLDDSKNYFRN